MAFSKTRSLIIKNNQNQAQLQKPVKIYQKIEINYHWLGFICQKSGDVHQESLNSNLPDFSQVQSISQLQTKIQKLFGKGGKKIKTKTKKKQLTMNSVKDSIIIASAFAATITFIDLHHCCIIVHYHLRQRKRQHNKDSRKMSCDKKLI